MLRISLLVAVVAASSLALPSAASAEYFPSDRSRANPTVQPEVWGYQNMPFEHDKGFFLRASVGPSWITSRTRRFGLDDDLTLRIEGAGFELSAAAGGIVSPNFAVHGTVTSIMSIQPRVAAGDVSGVGGTPGLLLVGFGPGITGFLPSNAYASMSFGGSVAVFNFSDGFVEPRTGYGIFWEGMFGKDWWVSGYTGVGIYGRITAHRVVTDLDAASAGVSLGFGINFTFN